MATEEVTVPRIKLGSQGLEVSAQGLGCMSMAAIYGPAKPEADMIELIHYAVNRGITHLDTADIYGRHTNEVLLGKRLLRGFENFLRLRVFTHHSANCNNNGKEMLPL